MATTKQQLEEQQRLKEKQLALQREQTQQNYDLDKKSLGLSETQLREKFDLENKGLGLSTEQLNQSFLLSQSQLKALEGEKASQSSKLAQQAYISKKQNERVMPDVLAAQGLANTGYVNVRKNQLEQGYQGQYGAIQDDLNSYMQGSNRQRESQNLNYSQNLSQIELQKQQNQSSFNQNLSQLELQKQQYELQYQQRMKAWELDNEAASLDFRQALNRLSASGGSGGSGSGGGGTISQSNVQLINTALSKAIKEGSLDTNSAALAAKGYYDQGYLEKQDYYNTVRGAKQLADAVAQLNARKPVIKNTKGR